MLLSELSVIETKSSTSWKWSMNRWYFFTEAEILSKTDRGQVPWGKVEKHSDRRLKKLEIENVEAKLWLQDPTQQCRSTWMCNLDPSWNTDQGVFHIRKLNKVFLFGEEKSNYNWWNDYYPALLWFSICEKTRKMVIYSWVGWSLRKLWWRF